MIPDLPKVHRSDLASQFQSPPVTSQFDALVAGHGPEVVPVEAGEQKGQRRGPGGRSTEIVQTVDLSTLHAQSPRIDTRLKASMESRGGRVRIYAPEGPEIRVVSEVPHDSARRIPVQLVRRDRSTGRERIEALEFNWDARDPAYALPERRPLMTDPCF